MGIYDQKRLLKINLEKVAKTDGLTDIEAIELLDELKSEIEDGEYSPSDSIDKDGGETQE